MKKYQKAQMIAKNLPTGSYAAGCPTDAFCRTDDIRDRKYCSACERAM